MTAALPIRESAKILEKQQSGNKLLLILSDGKPNDVDRYDGRYGIEDTKKAIEGSATNMNLGTQLIETIREIK